MAQKIYKNRIPPISLPIYFTNFAFANPDKQVKLFYI